MDSGINGAQHKSTKATRHEMPTVMANNKSRCKHGVKELRQVAGIVQVQLLHALQGNLSQARHAHVIGRTHTKANDFIVDVLAQIFFDAETQYVLQVPDNTGGGIANRQSGTGADYW